LDLIKNYSIKENQIAIAYDIFRRKTGEACIKIIDRSDFNEIKTLFNL
jgi:hypothetical protein